MSVPVPLIQDPTVAALVEVAEMLQDGLALVDHTHRLLYLNEAGCLLLGATEEELRGCDVTRQFPVPERAAIAACLSTASTEPRPWRWSSVTRPVAGRARAIEYAAQTHMVAGGVIVAVTLRDVTERRQLALAARGLGKTTGPGGRREALAGRRVDVEEPRETKERYRLIFEAANDALTITDPDGFCVEANPAAGRMYGYTREEMIGLHAVAFTHPNYHHLARAFPETVRAGGSIEQRALNLRKDGSPFWIEERASGILYEGRPHILSVIRDITAQVRAEEQLREREEQYRAIFEASVDGVAIASMDGVVVEANPAYCALFGYTREELIGMHGDALIHPDYRHLLAEAVRAIGAGWSSPSRVAVAVRKDGAPFYVDILGVAFTYRGKPHILSLMRDVTERIRTEEALREKEEQYRAVFDAIDETLMIADLDGVVVEANPAASRMYGYAHDDLVGLDGNALVHPDYHHFVAEALRTVGAGNSMVGGVVALRKDGTPFYSEGSSTTFTYRGRPHMLSVVRDVTERIRAEEALREREEQYRAIFEAVGEALMIADLEGFVVEANPAASRVYGYTRDEFIGVNGLAIVHPDDHHVVAEALRAIRSGSPMPGAVVALRKDGTPFYVEGSSVAFTYRGKPHMLSAARDVTERIRAEEVLREREEQYRAIFEEVGEAVLIGDLEGVVVEANPAACRLFGYTREELVGMHAGTLVHPDYHHVLAEALRVIGAGQPSPSQVAVAVRKDGTPLHVEGNATTLAYRGKPHLLSVMRDVTERVRAAELLERRVAERTRELSGLLDVSRHVASTLDLRPLLDLILDDLRQVVAYTGASIALIDADEAHIVGYRGPGSAAIAVGVRIPLSQMGDLQAFWSASEPVIIDDVRADTPLAVTYQRGEATLLDASFGYVRSLLVVPLVVNERLVGNLSLNHAEPGAFTPRHAELALAFARQAAVAIENARLYGRAQDAAILEERQRLSRELHDSVSQALYGIALGARTARALLDRDPAQVAAPLDYVLSLAEAGLAEMRALIFELLPEGLAREGLVAALRKQADAVRTRHGVAVTVALGAEPEAPLAIKEAIYRIAQEALHNTVKHARARAISLRLDAGPRCLVLEVADDGAGFDPDGEFPGHLGLRTMRERAERLGGAVSIESAVGCGSLVRAVLPLGREAV